MDDAESTEVPTSSRAPTGRDTAVQTVGLTTDQGADCRIHNVKLRFELIVSLCSGLNSMRRAVA